MQNVFCSRVLKWFFTGSSMAKWNNINNYWKKFWFCWIFSMAFQTIAFMPPQPVFMECFSCAPRTIEPAVSRLHFKKPYLFWGFKTQKMWMMLAGLMILKFCVFLSHSNKFLLKFWNLLLTNLTICPSEKFQNATKCWHYQASWNYHHFLS